MGYIKLHKNEVCKFARYNINNNVLGDKYSLIGEAVYEKQFSKGNSLSFGLRHTQSFANNEYRNGHYYETDMNQGDTYVYGEYRGKVKKLDYRLGGRRYSFLL